MSRPGYAETVQDVIKDVKPRCTNCGKPIGWMLTRPYVLQCRHCRVTNRSPGYQESDWPSS